VRLILTLLCRDEDDIIEQMLAFHLSRGVDLVIATDNGSRDGTRAILERYRRAGVLLLIDEPSLTHDQAPWVTRMARMAANDCGADWVINADADEFWWPRSGNLKQELAAVAADVAALAVQRFNLLPPAPGSDPALPFQQTMTLRERQSCNSLGQPLPPKVCHRAHRAISVDDGNHGVRLDGQPLAALPCEAIEILHVPVRSYAQLERKLRQGTEALERNPRTAATGIGMTWRSLYHDQLLSGRLPDYYRGLRPEGAALRQALLSGSLIDDRRLQRALWDLQPPALQGAAPEPPLPAVAVVTPYHGEDLATLERCHRSVRAQTIPCLHVLVADGRPHAALEHWQAHHVVLPVPHNDIGSTPRLVGCVHAIGLGVEAVAFLDADNWYDPAHIAGLMAARREQGAAYVSSSRMLWSLDGQSMGPCPLIDPQRFIDTNCMLFGREAFPLLHHWVLMPSYGHLIGDRILHHLVQQSGLPMAHVSSPSVNYRCGKEGLYRQLGLPIPPGVAPRPDYEASFARWVADGHPPLQ
jgi:Glycosyl transferase family 2